MPGQSHQRAAEFHELAAHAHRAAAASHDKEDHLTGHELSKEAMEHANSAFRWSQDAHQKSERFINKDFVTNASSSTWRTAYVAALFETDAARKSVRISDARAAIKERLNSPVEIPPLENDAIHAAQQGLAGLKVQHAHVVESAAVSGDTHP